MAQSNDLSFCLTALEQDSTLIAVIELGLRSWLVAGLIPGASRQPLKKLDPDAQEVTGCARGLACAGSLA